MYESKHVARILRGLLLAAATVTAVACSPETPPPPEPRLVRTTVVESAAASGVTRYTGEMGAQLISPGTYIEAVLGSGHDTLVRPHAMGTVR